MYIRGFTVCKISFLLIFFVVCVTEARSVNF